MIVKPSALSRAANFVESLTVKLFDSVLYAVLDILESITSVSSTVESNEKTLSFDFSVRKILYGKLSAYAGSPVFCCSFFIFTVI